MVRWRAAASSAVALLVAVLTLAGCNGDSGGGGNDGPQGEPKRGGILTYAVNADGASLDPAQCGSSNNRCGPLFGALLRYDLEKEELVPWMAESFDSSDGKTWTLKLRAGMTFTDGTPYDADAVVFNWDRIKDPATLSPSVSLTAGANWKVVDPQTVELTLDSPNYQMGWALAGGLGFIGSPTAIRAAGLDVGTKPVGAGPFVLDKWTPGTELVMSRNDSYFEDGLPYLDGLVIKIIGADDQRLNALRSGEIDVDWSLLAKDAKTMEAEGYNVVSVPVIGGTGLQFSWDDPVTSNEDLRQAMLHAFDSQQIVDAVYPGNESPDSFLRPDSPLRDDSLGKFPEFDLDKAQELFDAYLASTGKDSETVTFLSYAGIPALEQVAQLIQAQMQKIDGLTMEIEAVDAPTLSKRVASGDFQTVLGTTSNLTPDVMYNLAHSDGTVNYGNYSNPTVDEALETTRSSDDPDEVEEAYRVINSEISKDGLLRIYRYNVGFLFANQKVGDLVYAAEQNNGASFYPVHAWLDE